MNVFQAFVCSQILGELPYSMLHGTFGSTFTIRSTLFRSFFMNKPVQSSILQTSLHVIKFQLSPKFVNRNRVFRPNNLHPSKHQCIISLYPDHIFLFNWLYSKTLRTNAEYLPFAPNDKPLMVNKAAKTSEFTPSTPDHCNNNVNCTIFISYCVTKITKFFHNLKRLTI